MKRLHKRDKQAILDQQRTWRDILRVMIGGCFVWVAFAGIVIVFYTAHSTFTGGVQSDLTSRMTSSVLIAMVMLTGAQVKYTSIART